MTRRLRKAMDERDQGFTLIELLVVIIIIGILAAIAIPVFLNQRKKGVDAGLKSDLKNAATAAETYSTDNPGATTFVTSATPGPAQTAAQNFTTAGFKKSPGNDVRVTGGPLAGYQLCAFNVGASTAVSVTTAMQYDSQAGGLVAAAASCGTWAVLS